MISAAHEASLKNEALELLSAYLDAMVRGDVDALRATMEPTAVLTHMTGYEQRVDEWCQDVDAGSMRYHAIELVSSEIEAGVEGALLRARTRTDATIRGSRSTWRLALEMRARRGPDGALRIRAARASTW